MTSPSGTSPYYKEAAKYTPLGESYNYGRLTRPLPGRNCSPKHWTPGTTKTKAMKEYDEKFAGWSDAWETCW